MSVIRHFAVAVTFLTRTPIALRDVREADFGRAVTWFPAVGLMLGGVLVFAEQLMRGHVSAELLSLGLVTLLVALTGALHVDGVADVFDGLGGGRGNRERTLEIMRDSRIGAFGATAVVLLLLAKVFAMLEVQRAGMTWALWMFPVAARWAVCPLVVLFPYARKEGLGKPFNGHARVVHVVLATCITAGVLVAVGSQALGPTIAALGTSLWLAALMLRRLGGLTGDVYGAAIELSELAFLIVAISMRA
jgi:adenosylcobinamide-GDP ribazoletransferase